MSMILDALRKSEQQRVRSAADRLHEGPRMAPGGRFPGRVTVFVGAIALLAVAALLASTLESRVNRSGARPEIMENDTPASMAARVRDLGDELASNGTIETPATTESAGMPSGPAGSVERFPAPPIESLPASVRIRLPEMQLNIHAWAEDPKARFVMINLRRHQEGDRLEEGLTVHRILRSGVELQFEDHLFTLPRQ